MDTEKVANTFVGLCVCERESNSSSFMGGYGRKERLTRISQAHTPRKQEETENAPSSHNTSCTNVYYKHNPYEIICTSIKGYVYTQTYFTVYSNYTHTVYLSF